MTSVSTRTAMTTLWALCTAIPIQALRYRFDGYARMKAGPAPAGSVLMVDFELNGQKFVGLNGGPEFKFNEAISFQIHCKDQDEVDYYWNKLTEGGEENVCGWLKDKFGVSWQVIPDGLVEMLTDADPEKAKRTTEAMFAMKKLDIAALKKAHAGEYVSAH
jgi:predicted 3-demethylubiquinone-9 3-methyltransferase (glyoxalase superfamily)